MPSSPLILALLGLLNHLAPFRTTDQNETSQRNREDTSRQLVHLAFIAVDKIPPIELPELDAFTATPYHSNIPTQLEVPMTYCVLSLYEYLCWGNIDQMAIFAQKAVAFFGNIIHITEALPYEVFRFDESLRRVWWMAYLCSCNASTVSCKLPAEPINTSSIRIPYPEIDCDKDIWGQYIRAEESLVAATLLLVALVKGFGTLSTIPSFNRSLHLLGNLIDHQLAALPVASTSQSGVTDTPETRLISCFRILTQVRLNSARIKVHRYRAFMGDPRILRKFEEIASSDQTLKVQGTGTTYAAFNTSQACGIFPFTETYARRVWADSASMIAHDLRKLLAAGTIAAPSVCSAMIAGYTLMMMSSFDLASKEPSSAQKDTQTQCETDVKTALEVLGFYSVGSEFLKGLRGEQYLCCDLVSHAN